MSAMARGNAGDRRFPTKAGLLDSLLTATNYHPARLAPPMTEAQAEHYRNLADEARKKAKAAPTADFARQWTEIAKHYEMLAEFVAKPIRPKG
jgi:hypothetical protein